MLTPLFSLKDIGPPVTNLQRPPACDVRELVTRGDVAEIPARPVDIDFRAVIEPPDRIMSGRQLSNRPPRIIHPRIVTPDRPQVNPFFYRPSQA